MEPSKETPPASQTPPPTTPQTPVIKPTISSVTPPNATAKISTTAPQPIILNEDASISRPQPLGKQSVERGDVNALGSLRSQLETLRTYEGDIAEAVKHQKTSVIKVAVAEQKRKIERGEVEQVRKQLNINTGMIFGSFALIIIGASIAWGAYTWMHRPVSVPKIVLPGNPIVSSDFQQEIVVDGMTPSQIIEKIQAEKTKTAQGTVESIYFTKNSIVQTSSEFLTEVGVTPPGALARSLGDSFMLGTHNIKGGKFFIILTTNSFENAFPAMLAWEPTLFTDVKDLLGVPTSNDNAFFKDMVIKNKDTRVLETDDGNVLLVYSFPDKQHLIITNDTDTIAEIFTRLSAVPTISQ